MCLRTNWKNESKIIGRNHRILYLPFVMIFILNGRNNSIGGEKSWKNFVGNISKRSDKTRIFVLIYSLRSEMPGIVVEDFERICLSRPCVLILLERVFSIYFQVGGSGGRFCT